MFRSIIFGAAVAWAPVVTASSIEEHGVSTIAASFVEQQDRRAPFDLALSTGNRRLLGWVRSPFNGILLSDALWLAAAACGNAGDLRVVHDLNRYPLKR